MRSPGLRSSSVLPLVLLAVPVLGGDAQQLGLDLGTLMVTMLIGTDDDKTWLQLAQIWFRFGQIRFRCGPHKTWLQHVRTHS